MIKIDDYLAVICGDVIILDDDLTVILRRGRIDDDLTVLSAER